MKNVNIDISEVPLVIQNTKGKLFGVTFVKKDNSLRKMVCRLGVKKYLKGGINTTSHLSQYVTVFDISKKEYRNINMEKVKDVTFQNIIYMVND